MFLLGGMAFSIYPLSLSHACDELRPDQVLGANQGLLLAYSLGAMTGPLLAPFVMAQFGPEGLFVYFALCGLLLAGYLGWRKRQRAPIPLADHQVFIPVPPNTPMTAELEPRTDLAGEAYPPAMPPPDRMRVSRKRPAESRGVATKKADSLSRLFVHLVAIRR